jgi:DNA-binding IclR family transcriptional regulator
MEKYYLEGGLTPTTADLSERLGIGKGGSTKKLLENLERAGHIKFNDARNRYVLSNWRELAAGIFAEKAAKFDEVSQELERRIKQSRDRVSAYKKRQKKKKQ